MSYETSRRNFILGAGAAASLLLVPVAGASGAEADAYTQLIDRRRTFITGGQAAATHPALAAKRASIDGTVSTLRETLVKDPARTALWANLPLDKLGSLAAHTDNMGVTFNQITSLALAWASAGSIHHQDTALLADINGALKFMAGKYKSTTKKTGNWCFWEIGAPRQVADALVLLGEKAVKSDADALIAAVKYFAPDPNRRTGSATLRETGQIVLAKPSPALRAVSYPRTLRTLCLAATPSQTSPETAKTAYSPLSQVATVSTLTGHSSSTETCPTAVPTAGLPSLAWVTAWQCWREANGRSAIQT